jgi:hypothetical protein
MQAVINFFAGLTEAEGIDWLIGQLVGFVAIIVGFISYQVKTKRQLIFMQTAVAALFCVHYALLGEYSALGMNVVSVVRNIVYDYRTSKGITSRLIPIGFVVFQATVGIITWDAWYSVFALFGLCINTYAMSLSDSQSVRKSILITSPLVLTFDIFAFSISGAMYESVAIISAAIGVIRNRKTRSLKLSAPEAESECEAPVDAQETAEN